MCGDEVIETPWELLHALQQAKCERLDLSVSEARFRMLHQIT